MPIRPARTLIIATALALVLIPAAPAMADDGEGDTLPLQSDFAAEVAASDLPPALSQPSRESSAAPRTMSLAGTGTISGRVGFVSQAGAAPVFTSGAWVRFAFREADGTYTAAGVVPVGANGSFVSPALDAGSYDVHVVPFDTTLYGAEHFDDARYFADGTDVAVSTANVNLSDIVLEPRYYDVGRIAGPDRYSTAVEVSKTLFRDGDTAPVVYLASGVSFPDALSAGPAAIAHGGVVLTTTPGSLPDVIAEELDRIDPQRIVIVGGPAAVSEVVVSQVSGYSPDVDRIGGASRYETSELIVRDAFPDGAETAYIATGRGFADALAAGPAAGHENAPLLLVDGAATALAPSTEQLLDDLDVSTVRIAGGAAAVSVDISSALAAIYGPHNATRHAGQTRYETAIQVNAQAFGPSELSFVATGAGFADALSGGPLAGAYDSPLYLTPPTCLDNGLGDVLLDGEFLAVWLVGGPAVLSPDVANLYLCS